jgi:hypothetical protein
VSYARSKKAILKVESVLKDLLEATDDIAFVSTEPQRLAYCIHEALRSAAVYPEYTNYAELRNKFVIRVKSNKVLAEIRNRQPVALKIMKEQLSKMTLDEVTDVLGIVGAAVKHKATELHFPLAILSQDDLRTLYNWTVTSGYHIIHHDNAGLTLTKVHPGELAWIPSESNNGGKA